jgi:hypothetical protein
VRTPAEPKALADGRELAEKELNMDSIRIRVSQILDFGTIVTVVGTELGSNTPLAIHVDHKPFQTIWELWRLVDLPQPVSFESDGLCLCLDFNPDDDQTPSPLANLSSGHRQC